MLDHCARGEARPAWHHLVGARDRPGVVLGGALLTTREDDTLVRLLAICLSPVRRLFTSFDSVTGSLVFLLSLRKSFIFQIRVLGHVYYKRFLGLWPVFLSVPFEESKS